MLYNPIIFDCSPKNSCMREQHVLLYNDIAALVMKENENNMIILGET